MNFLNVQFTGFVEGRFAKFAVTMDTTEDVFVFAESAYDIIGEACEEIGLTAHFDEEEAANNTDPNTDCVTVTFMLPCSDVPSFRSQFATNIGLQRVYGRSATDGVWYWIAAQISRAAFDVANSL